MRNLEKYKGIIPAFYACYDDQGNISPERVQLLAQYFLDKGVKGLYVGGSSGECIYQSVEERKIVLENVMKAVGGKMTIIAHVAAPSTQESVELAKHAKELGADALAAIPPIYYGLSEKAIGEYWKAIALSTDLDFIIYNIPQTTGYALSNTLLKEMLKIDQVIGVKNSSMPILDINLFKNNGTKEIIVFNGPDEQFVGGRTMGADAGIGGTYGAMPELFIKLDKLVKEEKIQEALNLQNKINDIIMKLLSGEGSMYAIIKRVLALQGLEVGKVREPFPQATESDNSIVQEAFEMIQEAIDNI